MSKCSRQLTIDLRGSRVLGLNMLKSVFLSDLLLDLLVSNGGLDLSKNGLLRSLAVSRHILYAFFGVVAIPSAIGAFVSGPDWVHRHVFQLLSPPLTFVSGLVLLPACLLLLLFRFSRGIAGLGLFVASHLFFIHLWLACLVTLGSLAGRGGLLVGLLLAGIGVVPVSIVVSALYGAWSFAGGTLLLGLIVLGVRFLGITLVTRAAAAPTPSTSAA